jgi:hypothetical protein
VQKFEHVFLVDPAHLTGWTETTRATPDEVTLDLERVAETLLETVFILVYHTHAYRIPNRSSVKCIDDSLEKGERSVEIESIYPFSAAGHKTLVYRVTITDTLGQIDDVVRTLTRENLLSDDDRLQHLLEDNVRYNPTPRDPDNTLFVLAAIGLLVFAVLLGVS